MAKMLASSWVTTTTVAPRTVPYPEDQIIQPFGAHRIQTRRWFVKKKDFRIECHCARQTGPFAHTAADFRRIEILESGKGHQCQFQGDLISDFFFAQFCILLQG